VSPRRYLRAVLARLPVRVRVTLAFTAAVALLLVAAGLFTYWQLGRKLDGAIDDGLRARAADVAAQAGRGPLAQHACDVA
jgi:hypothetical protein